MSVKAARGTKRVCHSCGGKFYDLNRDPIICPLCQSTYHQDQGAKKSALAGNAVEDDEDDIVTSGGGVELVSLDEVADEENLPDIEGDDLIEDDGDLPDDDDETFIEVEDDDEGDDVTGIVGGSIGNDDDA